MPQIEALNTDYLDRTDDEFAEAFFGLAKHADLTTTETETLYTLCQEQTSYPTYTALRAKAMALQGTPGVTVRTIGHSHDYPDTRPIDMTIVGDPEGKLAYVEGSQHGPEEVGSATAEVIEEQAMKYPEMYRRWGYDGIAVSSHADPDAMLLQGDSNAAHTLHDFIHSYRGAIEDQICWGFPITNSQPVRAEVAATLHVLQNYNLGFFGALHGTFLAGQVLTSVSARRGTEFYAPLLTRLDMLVDPMPDEIQNQELAPGVYAAPNEPLYRGLIGSETIAKIDQMPITGTSVCDYLDQATIFMIPDFPCLTPVPGDRDLLTGKTRIDVIQERTRVALRLMEHMGELIEPLRPWVEAHDRNPDVARLHRAVEWWHTAVPILFERRLAVSMELYGEDRRELRQPECDITVPYIPMNTAIYLGNLARLATMAGRLDIASAALADADQAFALFGRTQPIPIWRQVAAQTLATFIGMKHARD